MNLSAEFARQRKITAEKVDAKATALYDRLNPNWQIKINVSKAECIARVLRLRSRQAQAGMGGNNLRF